MSCDQCGGLVDRGECVGSDAQCDTIAQLRAERDRLLKSNTLMEAVLEDLYGTRDGETCGRVQCRNAIAALRKKLAHLSGPEETV